MFVLALYGAAIKTHIWLLQGGPGPFVRHRRRDEDIVKKNDVTPTVTVLGEGEVPVSVTPPSSVHRQRKTKPEHPSCQRVVPSKPFRP